MANTMRWRYGDTNPVLLPVDVGYSIEIGDLVYLEIDDARPASSQADQLTLAANQEMFHDKFLGVAMQAADVGGVAAIRIATSGVFEFDCLSESFEVGDLVGSREEATGTQLDTQIVTGVATENLAIGRCVKRVPTPGSKVLVDIASTIARGGPQVAA